MGCKCIQSRSPDRCCGMRRDPAIQHEDDTVGWDL
jgi:hypothetical protein